MNIRIAIVCMLLITMNSLSATAQQKVKKVYGKILLEAPVRGEKPKPFPVSEKVYVFAFNTVEAARNTLKQLESGGGTTIMSDAETIAGTDGYYEIRVAETGALIIHAAMVNKLEEVKGRKEINPLMGPLCEFPGSYPSQENKNKPFPKYTPYAYPNRLLHTYGVIGISPEHTKSNMRIILQPYYVDCTTGDTIISSSPQIVQGRKFKVKGDPNHLFFPNRHPLEKYINPRRSLMGGRINMYIRDTIRIPDIKHSYSTIYRITVEKQKKVIFKKDLKYTGCKMRKPLSFLDLSVLNSFETDKDSMTVRLWNYIQTCDAVNAQNIADILPDTEHYRMLKAFAYALCGYYDFTKAADIADHQLRKNVFDIIKESSALNRVVMYIAICNALYDMKAQEALKSLPQEDALTYYFKAILNWRSDIYRTKYESAANNLLEAFRRNKKLITVAANDGDIEEELYETVMDRYKTEKQQ